MAPRTSVCAVLSLATASLCLGAALVGLLGSQELSLAASSNQWRSDLDRDGLTDLQELVSGTDPYLADTDGDTYSDLEERARGTNPLDSADVPSDEPFSLGMCASQENGFVSALSVVYLEDRPLESVRFQFGVVYHGIAFRFIPNSFQHARGFVRPARG
jgi:hypothetical protein